MTKSNSMGGVASAAKGSSLATLLISFILGCFQHDFNGYTWRITVYIFHLSTMDFWLDASNISTFIIRCILYSVVDEWMHYLYERWMDGWDVRGKDDGGI